MLAVVGSQKAASPSVSAYAKKECAPRSTRSAAFNASGSCVASHNHLARHAAGPLKLASFASTSSGSHAATTRAPPRGGADVRVEQRGANASTVADETDVLHLSAEGDGGWGWEGVRGIGVRGVAEVAEREPERLEPIVGILLDGAGEVGAAAEDGAAAVRALGVGDGDAGGGQDDRLERGRAHVHREDALARVVGRRDRARGSRRAAGGEGPPSTREGGERAPRTRGEHRARANARQT